jgi:hypothetical protein
MRVYKTTRTRIPVPETIPHFTIKPVAGCRLEVRFLEPGKSNRHHNAKPFGVHGAFIIWAVLPEAPASFNDLGHSQFAARSPIYLHFDFADAGKRCYIAICWENTRSERGPWSAIKSATIPD